MVGKTLGHYEIIEQLGAGGMGEVYLGEDTRLGRKVAIKVLPEEYASDPERLAHRQRTSARSTIWCYSPHGFVVTDVAVFFTDSPAAEALSLITGSPPRILIRDGSRNIH